MSIQKRVRSEGNLKSSTTIVVTAVAIMVQVDRLVFYNCTTEGRNSALYALAHRQFYYGCKISGSADMITSDTLAVI
ncbi:Putative pectinesterase/pectinesterase inhibitor 28 [Linum perenne]